MQTIADCTTALTAWLTLERHYALTLGQQSTRLLIELSHLSMARKESQEKYSSRAQKLRNEYLAGGNVYPEKHFGQQLMAGQRHTPTWWTCSPLLSHSHCQWLFPG